MLLLIIRTGLGDLNHRSRGETRVVGPQNKPREVSFWGVEPGFVPPFSPAHLHRVLADAQGVPELDGLVPGARNDLAVVGGEGHAQHVLGVAHEAAGGGASAGGAEVRMATPNVTPSTLRKPTAAGNLLFSLKQEFERHRAGCQDLM